MDKQLFFRYKQQKGISASIAILSSPQKIMKPSAVNRFRF
jgi:hypothetical protein